MTRSKNTDLTRRKFLKWTAGGLAGAGAVTLGLKPWKKTAKGATINQTRPAMGTFVEITARGEDKGRLTDLVDKAYEEINEVDNSMSVFKDKSRVYRLNVPGKRKVDLTPNLVEVLTKGQRISKVTNGSFDMTAGPLLDLWGFYDGELSVPSTEELSETLKLVDYRGLEIDSAKANVTLPDPDATVDLGGIAKGYGVDNAVEVLKRDEGVSAGLVNAGGDIRGFGTREPGRDWKVGLQHPLSENELVGTLNLTLNAVTTSGNYESFFTYQGSKLAHIINPRDGRPVENTLSVSILTDKAIDADGLSTGLFSQTPKEAVNTVSNLDDTELIYIWKENGKLKAEVTKGVKEEVEMNRLRGGLN